MKSHFYTILIFLYFSYKNSAQRPSANPPAHLRPRKSSSLAEGPWQREHRRPPAPVTFSSIFTNSSSVSLEIFGGWGWETPIFMARLGMKGGEKSMGKCMGSEWHMQKILRKKRWSRELRYFIAKGWRMKLCNYPKLTQNWRATCQDILAQAWPVEKHGSSVIHLSLRNIFQVEHCPTKNDRHEKRVKSSSPLLSPTHPKAKNIL